MRSFWLALATLPALAQSSSQDPIIRVSVDLVQIDATVTDSAGRHVADLRPEDFVILEDGKPQTITHFSYVAGQLASWPRQPEKPRRFSLRRPRPSHQSSPLLNRSRLTRSAVPLF